LGALVVLAALATAGAGATFFGAYSSLVFIFCTPQSMTWREMSISTNSAETGQISDTTGQIRTMKTLFNNLNAPNRSKCTKTFNLPCAHDGMSLRAS
jgi:hypothetical protein